MVDQVSSKRKRGTGIQVFARFRPQNKDERRRGGHECITFDVDGKGISVKDKREHEEVYTFDRVFQENCTQKEVYDASTRALVEDLFRGYYATVFAYGQTGSGKTHTMEGQGFAESGPVVDGAPVGNDMRGVIPRAVEHIFDKIESQSSEQVDIIDYKVTVSYVEIYLERIRDLLDKSGTKTNLGIKVDVQRGVYIDGATEVEVECDIDLLKLLERGFQKRNTASTNMNEVSSRSHAICMISLQAKNLTDLRVKTGKLFLVDLAGSEMVAKTGATDKRLEEAKQINKSLSALGIVIKALTEGKTKHVPYRDSKLTRILQDSLGGTARASLIIACTPSSYNLQETMSTLRFGTRAKFIKNKPRVHVGYGGTETDELLQKRDMENGQLKEDLAAMAAQMANLSRENGLYEGAYGEAPREEDAQAVKGGRVLPEQYLHALRYCSMLEGELFALRREAGLVRQAAREVGDYLADQRDIVAEVRLRFAKQIRLGAPSAELKAELEDLDQVLAMSKWKSQGVLKSLNPLSRAAKAIEKAVVQSTDYCKRHMIDKGQPVSKGARVTHTAVEKF